MFNVVQCCSSLFQVPEILRSIPSGRVFRMRRQTQVLWERYLSSVEKIVMTTLEVSEGEKENQKS
jgi:hypothetical protein